MSKKSRLISRKVLEDYMQTGKISNLHAFLLSLLNKEGLGLFSHYLKHNENFAINADKGVLFHGSENYNESLTPNSSMGSDGNRENEAFVYATENPDYAIFLAIIRLQDAEAGVIVEDGNAKLSISPGFVNGLSLIKEGFLHVVSSEDFEKTSNSEYQSKSSIETLFAFEVTSKDLSVPIEVRA